ncbi:CHASE3 domain-containing protein [Actinomycetospora atypica]|uniref:CHASE3 domain-containing protein n=1 Tax=Actinomycetospora atypica TaxID=1290095 RepID=A0ABV9YIX4_9PSEU
MLQGVRDRPVTWVQALIRQWERVPIRVQARITIALPLVAVIISALLAISGNSERVAIETDIQRKFEVSAALGGLSSLMVNAETGMRGYLLTGQAEFLEPFDQASRELAPAVASLRGLASAEPGEGPRTDILGRLGDVEDLSARQMADLSFQRAAVASGLAVTDPELRRHLEYGKQLMDRIRAEVGAMQAEERELLDARIAEINAIRVRDYVSVGLALVAALATRFLAWFLFRRGILRRVDRLTENLRDRRNGSPTPMEAPTKRDQMGQLEREVHLLDR